MLKRIFITGTGLFLATLLYSQSPDAFSYQAVLRDASGSVKANTETTILIELLQGTVTGTSVYSESFLKSTNAFGLLNLQIGNGTVVSGNFSTINWSEGPYFIKVSVDGTEMGTTQLLSVPYALYAKTAENISGTLNETDPVFGSSLAYSITADDTARWNARTSFSGYYNDLTGIPTFATVATTGSYNDLANKPVNATTSADGFMSASDKTKLNGIATGAEVNVNANWTATSGDSQILNKPTTTAGYGITDAVTTTGNQTIEGNKTFTGQLALDNSGNSVFIGKGAGRNDDRTDNRNVYIGDSAGFTNITSDYNVAVGYRALYSNTAGTQNTANGYGALFSNTTGGNNIANGYMALYTNTTGFSNIAIGHRALYYNTTGYRNNAIGQGALFSNTTGNNNIAIGTGALYANTTGQNNTATGLGALSHNTTGDHNTAIGDEGLTNNTIGNDNTALGYRTLNTNTTGNSNTATGYLAMYFNTTGYGNVANGWQSLLRNTTGGMNTAMGTNSLNGNTTGYYNAAVGASALVSNTTGGNNVAVGNNAMYSNTTASYNTAIGAGTLYDNVTAEKNTAVGYNALQNTVYWDNTAVGYYALYANTNGFDNVAIGVNCLVENTTGTGNTAIGKNAMSSNATGNNNTALGFNSDVAYNVSNSSAIGYSAKVYTDNTIRIGNNTVSTISGQVGWSYPSDGRFKTNVTQNVPGLEFILKLNPVTFKWDIHKLDAFMGVNDSIYFNNPALEKARLDKEAIVYTGFIAQEVEKAAEDCNYDFSGINKPTNDKTPYSLSYSDFVVPLVKAIQEQQEEIELLKKQNKELMQLILDMKNK